MSRALSHIRLTHEQVEGNYVQRSIVTCSACRVPYPYPRIPPALTDKFLTQRGWVSPTDPRRATCAKCIADAKVKAAAPAEPPKEVIPMPKPAVKPAAPVAAPVIKTLAELPRLPTREDNRRIRQALDEHYDDGGPYYFDDLSDVALADKLNVPRAWVSDLREQSYGPDTNVAAIRKVATAVDLEKRLTVAIDDAVNRAADLEALRAEVRAFLASTGKAA